MNEMAILLKTVENPIIEPFIPEILALVDAFGQSGQSGGSAGFTASAIAHAVKKLCMQDPICDITGIEMEWMDVSKRSGSPVDTTLYQNKRCSAVFRMGEHGRAYYIDAIVKKAPNGNTWTGPLYLTREDAISGNANGDPSLNIGCSHLIKSFPFKPKTFYIDCLEEEIAKDDWIMWVKDPKQLEAVWKYYDQMPRS